MEALQRGGWPMHRALDVLATVEAVRATDSGRGGEAKA